MKELLLVLLTALLAWIGGRCSQKLPHYQTIRREIPARTLVTVTLATTGATIAVWQSEMWLTSIFLALWSVLFALVAVIDIETQVIPNLLILPAIGAALAGSLVDPRLTFTSALLGAVVGFALFYLLYHLGRLLYTNGLGRGDVNLSTFIGAVTGVESVLYSLLIGMIASALILLLLLALRRVTLKSYVPYAPYLCFGGWLGMLPAVIRLVTSNQ